MSRRCDPGAMEAYPTADPTAPGSSIETMAERTPEPAGGRFALVGLHVVAFLFALSLAIGPTIMAAAVNERLEQACPAAATNGGGWTFDLDSWLPLLWSCEVTPRGGDVQTIRVWETGW